MVATEIILVTKRLAIEEGCRSQSQGERVAERKEASDNDEDGGREPVRPERN